MKRKLGCLRTSIIYVLCVRDEATDAGDGDDVAVIVFDHGGEKFFD